MLQVPVSVEDQEMMLVLASRASKKSRGETVDRDTFLEMMESSTWF